MRRATFVLGALCLIPCMPAVGQQLIVAYDFEGEVGSAFATDKSGFGTALDAIVASGAAIIDDTERGDVLQTSSAGFGAQSLYDAKLDFETSFALQAWVKTSVNSAWQHVAGRPGSGPRMFNHWGLGSLGAAQRTNPWVGGFEPVDFGPGGAPDNLWHHLLITWNHVEQAFYGYWDGINGNSDEGNGMFGNSPNVTDSTALVTHEGPPGLIFSIGGDPNTGGGGPANSLIDDVAFWNAYAPADVVAGLADGTYTIFNAPLINPGGFEADFDQDGDVDGNDFLLWQGGFPMASGAVKMDGDYDNDEDVDGNDFLGWQAEFPSPGSGAGSAAVPEPATAALLTAVLLGLMVVRRRY